MSQPFKATDLVKEVRKLAKEYPNAVYEQKICFYFKGKVKNGPNTCGCLIGQGLRRLNANPKLIEPDPNDQESIEDIFRRLEIRGEKSLQWLQDVQCEQDFSMPWAKAIEIADQRNSK